jgi:D-alanyl-lipoteichoic acid acyltransferase DltB (MBOAT superfamily)
VSFNSLPFWLFSVVAVGGHRLLPDRFRWAWLLAASYVFYGSFGLRILGVLVGLTACVYATGRLMDRSRGLTRRVLFLAAIAIPLATLVGCKYLAFIWQAISSLAGGLIGTAPAAGFNILVPIGISFYVFKLLSYAVDVHRHRIRAETHVGHFALYISYFPQILAGPIERAGDLLPQLRRPGAVGLQGAVAGARLVAWGLFKKLVVADRLAYYVSELFLSPQYKSLHLLFGGYFYYLQIYCDFSGYSDISNGLSKMLGVTPVVNFNYPYLSRSVGEFWARWHITLSTWLRDYLFLPITYAAMRRVRSDRRWGMSTEVWGYGIGTLLTMLVAGLWHGAAWTFVAWGAYHGACQFASVASRRLRRRVARAIGLARRPRVRGFVAWLATFHLVTIAWIVFRASSLENAWTYFRYFQLRLPSAGVANLLFNLTLVGILLAMEYVQRHRERFALLDRVPPEAKALGYAAFAIGVITFSAGTDNPFIYFRF